MNLPRILAWSAGFLAFPIAGGAVAGRVDDPVSALTGGPRQRSGHRRRTGARVLAAHRRPALDPGHRRRYGHRSGHRRHRRRIRDRPRPARPHGRTHGCAARHGPGLSPHPAARAGAGSGPRRCHRSGRWAGPVTTLLGIDVESQYTNFGASGAITFAVLSGLLLERLLPGDSHRDDPARDVRTATSRPAEPHRCRLGSRPGPPSPDPPSQRRPDRSRCGADRWRGR